MFPAGRHDHPDRSYFFLDNIGAIEWRFWGCPVISMDHPPVEFGLVPRLCNRHPPVDFSLQSRIIGAQMKGVDSVNDISHQIAHLVVADMRDLGPWDLFAVGIDHGHIAPVAGPGDRRLPCMYGLEVCIAHAKQCHGLGKLGRDALFVMLFHPFSSL